MKTQTNLSSLLLISFALFFQMGCGSNITKMIDQLSLDPQYVKLTEEQDSQRLKESQNILSTVQKKLHDITKGQGDPNEDITLNNQQPSTLLELMIVLEGEAGVQFPNKLFKYLRAKGMDIEKSITEEVTYDQYERNDCSPLYYAIQWSAANIARWLLETGADISTVTCIDTSDLWMGPYTSVDDKVALLDALAKRGFNFNKNITPDAIANLVNCGAMSVAAKVKLLTALAKHGSNFNNLPSWPIEPLVVDKDISVDDKIHLLDVLSKHGFNFHNVTSWPICELVIDKDISVDDKIHLLGVLHNYGVDLTKIHVSSQQDSSVTVLPPRSNFIINFLFSPPSGYTGDISDDEITGKVRLLDALVQYGCSFNAADKMGYRILYNIINYSTYVFSTFTRYSIKCLEKILKDRKYSNLQTELYDTFFTTENYARGSNLDLPWEAAVAKGNIELAVLLIKAIKPEDVKTKFLIYANGEEYRHLDKPSTQFDCIRASGNLLSSLTCADREKIRQAFTYIEIQEAELAT